MKPKKTFSLSIFILLFAAFFLNTSSFIMQAEAQESETIANYQTDFRSGTPNGCWQYLWNEYGSVGDSSHYSPLIWDNSYKYDEDGNPDLPDHPGLDWGHLHAQGGHPGPTVYADGSYIDRYVIASCTVSELGSYSISDSFITNSSPSCGEGGDIKVFVNDNEMFSRTFGNGESTHFDIDLGDLQINDAIYIMSGPNGADSCDDFQWNFSIDHLPNQSPEPTPTPLPPVSPTKTFVASYQSGFQADHPASCWEYLWNAEGEIGDSSNYAPLVWDGVYRYDSDGQFGLPDPSHMTWGHLHASGGHPGAGSLNSASPDRYAIAACTIDQAGDYTIEESGILNVSDSCGAEGELRVYVNDILKLDRTYENGAGTPFDIDLGSLNPEDKIYVAAGPSNEDSCDDFEWDFAIYRSGTDASSPMNWFNFADILYAAPDTPYNSNGVVMQASGALSVSNPAVTIVKNDLDTHLQTVSVDHEDIIALRTKSMVGVGDQVTTKVFFNDLATSWTVTTVEQQSIVAPTGPVSGYTSGQFQVNEAGAATYGIPIMVSPGTAGMQPSLSIAYSSQGGNGLLGVGWSLSGLTTIIRCSATLAQDGFIDRVDFDDNDRFCLDGERLINVNGEYGADGTEYRTEHNSFSRITSYGQAASGPAWFTVETKAGLKLTLGNSSDSRIEAHGRNDAMYWAVNRVEDTLGNYFIVNYAEESAHTEFRPVTIEYTGNEEAGLTPYAKVVFEYEGRNDVTRSFVAGSTVKSTVRLKRIETSFGSDESLVRSYTLSYEDAPGTGRSRLVSLTECGADGSCFDPTTFDWQSLSDNFSFYGQGSGQWVGHNGFQPGFDGRWTGHRGTANNNFVGDFNGDDLADIVGYSAGNDWHGCLSTGHRFNCDGPYWFAHNGGPNNNFIGDFNGDGHDDFLKYAEQTEQIQDWRIFISNGDETFTRLEETWLAHNGGPSNNFVGDFNGDGRDDLLKYADPANHGNGKWRVFFSTGNGFSDAGTWSGHAGSQTNNYVGDFDGDGRDDIATRNYSGFTPINMEICYSNGNNAFSCQIYPELNILPLALAIGDIDSQFGVDFVGVIGDKQKGFNTRICQSLPNRTFHCGIWNLIGGLPTTLPVAADFTGDGLADLLFDDGDGRWHVYRSNGYNGFELFSLATPQQC